MVKGHLIRCCRKAPQKRLIKSSTNINEVVEDPISQLYMFPSSKTKLLKTVVNIDGKEVETENDTGALVSVMTHTEYKRLCNQKSRLPLHAAKINWKTYTGEMIKVVVNHQSDEDRLPLVIVKSKEPNLHRRDRLMKLKQDLHMKNQVRMKEELTTLISRCSYFSE